MRSELSLVECKQIVDDLYKKDFLSTTEQEHLLQKLQLSKSDIFCQSLYSLYQSRYQAYLKNVRLQLLLKKKYPSETAEDIAIQYFYTKVSNESISSGIVSFFKFMTPEFRVVLGIRSILHSLQMVRLVPDDATMHLARMNLHTFMALAPVYQLYNQLGFSVLARMNMSTDNKLFSAQLLRALELQSKLNVSLSDIDQFHQFYLNTKNIEVLHEMMLSFGMYFHSEILKSDYENYFKSADLKNKLHQEISKLFNISLDGHRYALEKLDDRLALMDWLFSVYQETISTLDGCRELQESMQLDLSSESEDIREVCENAMTLLNRNPAQALSLDEKLNSAKQKIITCFVQKKNQLTEVKKEIEDKYQTVEKDLKEYETQLDQAKSALNVAYSANVNSINSEANKLREQLKRTVKPGFALKTTLTLRSNGVSTVCQPKFF